MALFCAIEVAPHSISHCLSNQFNLQWDAHDTTTAHSLYSGSLISEHACHTLLSFDDSLQTNFEHTKNVDLFLNYNAHKIITIVLINTIFSIISMIHLIHFSMINIKKNCVLTGNRTQIISVELVWLHIRYRDINAGLQNNNFFLIYWYTLIFNSYRIFITKLRFRSSL